MIWTAKRGRRILPCSSSPCWSTDMMLILPIALCHGAAAEARPRNAGARGVLTMGEASRQIGQCQTWIDRLQAGDLKARDELLGHACERLRRLTRKMLKGFVRLKRWELTD